MNQTKATAASAEQKENEKEERQQMVDFGAATVKSSRGTVYILTIIGRLKGIRYFRRIPKRQSMSMFCRCWPLWKRPKTSMES